MHACIEALQTTDFTHAIGDQTNEVLYGRAGYLSACVQLNAHFATNVVSVDVVDKMSRALVDAGARYVDKHRCSVAMPPETLMYSWHDKACADTHNV